MEEDKKVSIEEKKEDNIDENNENKENKILSKKKRDMKKKNRMNKKLINIPEEIDLDDKKDENMEKLRKINVTTTKNAGKIKKGKCNGDCVIF